jgi:hypothetical protein
MLIISSASFDIRDPTAHFDIRDLTAHFDIRDPTAHYRILSLWVADFAADVTLGHLILLHISRVYVQQSTIAQTSTDSSTILTFE